MKVRVLKVTDTNEKSKYERIWNSTRMLPFLEIGAPMYLEYADDPNLVRTTSQVIGFQENLDEKIKTIHTLNSIYTLEVLEE